MKTLVDTDAEASVLGSVLLAPRALHDVADLVQTGDFAGPRHRAVYDAMLRLAERGEPLDAVTLTHELEREGRGGGDELLRSLVASAPSPGNVTRYAHIVRDLAARRRAINAAESLLKSIADTGRDLDEALGVGVEALLHAGAADNGVVTVGDVASSLEALYVRGLPPGPATGWPNVDKHYRPAPGQWTVLTGIPGHGKSTWLNALLVNLAQKHGHRFVFFSPENAPVARHVAELVSVYTGRPFGQDTLSRPGLARAVDWVNEHFVWLDPNEDTTIRSIHARFAALHAHTPFHGLVIDPWNELEHQRTDRMSETEYISSALTQVRRFARRHGIHTWVVAHPTKLQKIGDGEYPVPTPYDISGSAHWRNKADFAVAVYRDVTENEKPVELHVQKVRFKEHGRVGVVELHHDPANGTYRTSWRERE